MGEKRKKKEATPLLADDGSPSESNLIKEKSTPLQFQVDIQDVMMKKDKQKRNRKNIVVQTEFGGREFLAVVNRVPHALNRQEISTRSDGFGEHGAVFATVGCALCGFAAHVEKVSFGDGEGDPRRDAQRHCE